MKKSLTAHEYYLVLVAELQAQLDSLKDEAEAFSYEVQDAELDNNFQFDNILDYEDAINEVKSKMFWLQQNRPEDFFKNNIDSE